MNTQIFTPWSVARLPASGRVAFEGITYAAGMRIALRETKGDRKRFYLDFPELPTALRVMNESMRLATLPLVPKDSETSFFFVENSEFVAWLNKESLGIYENDPIFHLAIVAEEWVDIICNDNPLVVIEN